MDKFCEEIKENIQNDMDLVKVANSLYRLRFMFERLPDLKELYDELSYEIERKKDLN